MQIGARDRAEYEREVSNGARFRGLRRSRFWQAAALLRGNEPLRDSKARACRQRYVNTRCMARFSKNPLELHHRVSYRRDGTRGFI